MATLRFFDDATNILFVGPPGVGKTMLSVVLGRAAVEAGHRVYFTTAANSARCHKAALEGRWKSCMKLLRRPETPGPRPMPRPRLCQVGRERSWLWAVSTPLSST
ncbi:ATP-binding protein [Streptomyces sp. NPDC048337]|uniref:ATP-binding protein n=1 Tax=Streptomyces sp. NPDC048337 TaxID=3365535 RepID=UPI00372422FE